MEKKTDTKSRTALQTSHTNKQLQQYSGGIPIQDSRSSSCDKPKQALIALIICCGEYMAVSMPGHGDLTALLMSRTALYLTLWVPTVV